MSSLSPFGEGEAGWVGYPSPFGGYLPGKLPVLCYLRSLVSLKSCKHWAWG